MDLGSWLIVAILALAVGWAIWGTDLPRGGGGGSSGGGFFGGDGGGGGGDGGGGGC